MFCSNCGVSAQGNFCHACGSKLRSGGPEVATEGHPPANALPWQEEFRYDVLLKLPHIRDTLARIAAESQPGISAAEFLGLCESAFKPLGPISLAKAAPLLQKLYGGWGIRTGKRRTEQISLPVGETLFSILQMLARGSHTIKEVIQQEEGCIVRALIPSSLFAMEGSLVVAVTRTAMGTDVEAAAEIPGQWYDWGVSQRLLDRLFARFPKRAAFAA